MCPDPLQTFSTTHYFPKQPLTPGDISQCYDGVINLLLLVKS